MKYFLLILLFVHLSCQHSSQDNSTNTVKIDENTPNPHSKETVKSTTEHQRNSHTDAVIDSVVDRIYQLEKVQLLNKSHKVSILTEEPTTPDDFYNFKVGFNGTERFETYYIFSFKISDSTIYYYDVVNDELIDIKNWK
ncbi:MAG: hypothetical protein JNL70_04750 [Saprospiraceae bacterium]|nr:hypothetical protein [Saprospiraceae bacterium]